MEEINCMNENCMLHSQAIARIETGISGIERHLETLNGRTGKSEDRIGNIEQQLAQDRAYHEAALAYRRQLEERLGRISAEVDVSKSNILTLTGNKQGIINSISQLTSLVTLVMVIWMAYSSHQQALAVQHPVTIQNQNSK